MSKNKIKTGNEDKKIYIVIPAYNESGHIIQVIDNIKNCGYENIIVVDDGSSDNTSELATKCGAITLRHLINRGVGAATQTAIKAAVLKGADVVVTFDADEQFNPSDIPVVVGTLLKEDTAVCIGSRFKKKNKIPISRRFFNLIANIITYLLSGIMISDSQSGFKAFTKDAAMKININMSGYEFCTEIIRQISGNNLSFAEAPIDVYYSKESMGKGQNFAQGMRVALKLFINSLMK